MDREEKWGKEKEEEEDEEEKKSNRQPESLQTIARKAINRSGIARLKIYQLPLPKPLIRTLEESYLSDRWGENCTHTNVRYSMQRIQRHQERTIRKMRHNPVLKTIYRLMYINNPYNLYTYSLKNDNYKYKYKSE